MLERRGSLSVDTTGCIKHCQDIMRVSRSFWLAVLLRANCMIASWQKGDVTTMEGVTVSPIVN
jgi:hypothetical protein